jgi:hypothetical protein
VVGSPVEVLVLTVVGDVLLSEPAVVGVSLVAVGAVVPVELPGTLVVVAASVVETSSPPQADRSSTSEARERKTVRGSITDFYHRAAVRRAS